MTTLTGADTCRKCVLPKLYATNWTDDQISEQKNFTDGRIVVARAKPWRRSQKRTDYLLKYRRDFTLARESFFGESGCQKPRAKEDLEHLPPEELVESILQKEKRIAELMGEIQKTLAKSI